MTQQEPPKIEFPCDFPIKVIGMQSDEFIEHVHQVFGAHAHDFEPSKITQRPSGKGTFLALTIVIEATGQPQLEAITAALKAKSHLVKMVI